MARCRKFRLRGKSGKVYSRRGPVATALQKKIKQRRLKPGTVHRHHYTTALAIPRQQFLNLVREIVQNIRPDLHFEVSAIDTLQELAEVVLVSELEMANRFAAHAGRVTLEAQDMELSKKIRMIMSRH